MVEIQQQVVCHVRPFEQCILQFHLRRFCSSFCICAGMNMSGHVACACTGGTCTTLGGK